MLGYCVEYTAKLLFLMYKKGLPSFKTYVEGLARNYNILDTDYMKDNRIRAYLVRTAIDNYQSNMKTVYNLSGSKIRSISYEKLINEDLFLILLANVLPLLESKFLTCDLF